MTVDHLATDKSYAAENESIYSHSVLILELLRILIIVPLTNWSLIALMDVDGP